MVILLSVMSIPIDSPFKWMPAKPASDARFRLTIFCVKETPAKPINTVSADLEVKLLPLTSTNMDGTLSAEKPVPPVTLLYPRIVSLPPEPAIPMCAVPDDWIKVLEMVQSPEVCVMLLAGPMLAMRDLSRMPFPPASVSAGAVTVPGILKSTFVMRTSDEVVAVTPPTAIPWMKSCSSTGRVAVLNWIMGVVMHPAPVPASSTHVIELSLLVAMKLLAVLQIMRVDWSGQPCQDAPCALYVTPKLKVMVMPHVVITTDLLTFTATSIVAGLVKLFALAMPPDAGSAAIQAFSAVPIVEEGPNAVQSSEPVFTVFS